MSETQYSRNLSIRLPLGQGLRGWVVERPAAHLSPDEADALLEDLKTIAAKTLPGEALDYGVFDPDSGALHRSLITVLYEGKSGTPVAFNSMPILDLDIRGRAEQVLHLGLVMVDPDARSSGLSSMLYGFACALVLIKNQFRPTWVSSVTQVPAVVGLVAEMYSDTYPSPRPGARRSFEHLQIARRIMQDNRDAFGVGDDAGFDEQSFIISNAYTGGSDNLKKTYDAAPKHRNDSYNRMCRDNLDYDRGDDYLQVGRLDVNALRQYLLKIAPDTLFIGPVLGVAFFWFQTVMLPILHWFDDRKEWGMLRPWKS